MTVTQGIAGKQSTFRQNQMTGTVGIASGVIGPRCHWAPVSLGPGVIGPVLLSPEAGRDEPEVGLVQLPVQHPGLPRDLVPAPRPRAEPAADRPVPPAGPVEAVLPVRAGGEELRYRVDAQPLVVDRAGGAGLLPGPGRHRVGGGRLPRTDSEHPPAT